MAKKYSTENEIKLRFCVFHTLNVTKINYESHFKGNTLRHMDKTKIKINCVCMMVEYIFFNQQIILKIVLCGEERPRKTSSKEQGDTG